jgi:hypothetical protein
MRMIRCRRTRSCSTPWLRLVTVVAWIVGSDWSCRSSVVMLVHAQMQAQWTPNDQNDGSGPLPLSMQQRQQLLQLEQQIASSPNPSATLEHVAQQNGLSASDLSRMLQRNQADLQAAGAAGSGGAASMVGAAAQRRGSSSRQHVVWTALTTVTSLVGRIVAHHPRWATLLVATLMCVWYVSCVAIPSTGCTWSTGPRQAWRTKGATTLWSPPLSHVQDLVNTMPLPTTSWASLHDDEDEIWSSFSPDRLYNVLQANDGSTTIQDGVTWHNTRTSNKKKRRFQKAVTTQVTRVLSNPDVASLSMDDTARDSYQQQQSELYLMYATQILHNLDLTEFASLESDQDTRSTSHRGHSPRDKLILVADRRLPFGEDEAWHDDSNEHEPQVSTSNPSPCQAAILVVPGLGDWSRYGLLPLLAWPLYDDDDKSVSLRLTVAPGGHWDGDLVVSVTILPTPSNESEEDESLDDSLSVQVRVTLLARAGKGCVAPTRAMATTLTRALARSVSTSLHQRVGMVQTRSRQSHTLQSATRQFALTKRGHRSRLERQMEEMAVERRRKWQRRNPSGVSNYRPSGERQRSPNHASYR